MFVEIVIGATGTGKSQHALEKINNSRYCFVYDYQDNGDFEHLPKFEGKFLPKCRLMRKDGYSYEDFISIAEEVFFDIGCLVVCEEASNMFKTNNKDIRMNDFLLSKRHRKTNFLMNFHNFRQVPPFIIDYTDIITIKKFNGGLDHLSKKGIDERILQCYKACRMDIRNSFTVGISNISDIFKWSYFRGVTIPDTFANNGKNSYSKKEEDKARQKALKIKNYEF